MAFNDGDGNGEVCTPVDIIADLSAFGSIVAGCERGGCECTFSSLELTLGGDVELPDAGPVLVIVGLANALSASTSVTRLFKLGSAASVAALFVGLNWYGCP